jgi:beta-phosphoglucomutase-like phosphatase (HAD superfamily)
VDCEILGELGYEITPEELAHRFAGFTTQSIFEKVGEELGRPVPPEMIKRAERETDRRLGEQVDVLPGVHEMLDLLDDPRCICSNSRGERLKISLSKGRLWDRFRPYVFSAHDVGAGRGKPAPTCSCTRRLCSKQTRRRRSSLRIPSPGVTGAVAAGMRVIGFTGASHSWPGHGDALIEAGALTTIRRLRDVPATVEAMREWRPETV